MRLLLLVQMPRFESLRIEPLTFKKCGAIEVQPATCCEDQPAVIFCLRSRLQGISGSISTSAWGTGFSSQWRIWWPPDRQPSFLIWGVPWKGMDRAWITVPGGCSDQLALSLHLENDGSTGGPLQPCWCSHSAPNTLRATRAASPQEYRNYLGMKGWGWVPEFLLMNLSTFMAEKIQSIINSINIFPHINIVRILVIFKWLSSSVPSGRLSKAMCSRSPEAGTWLISSFFFFYNILNSGVMIVCWVYLRPFPKPPQPQLLPWTSFLNSLLMWSGHQVTWSYSPAVLFFFFFQIFSPVVIM